MKKVFFLGPNGSYSYTITNKLFNDSEYELISCSSFLEIVKNVLTNSENIGILPIENSITSSVHENMDYLFNEKLTIIAESYLKITLFLFGLKDAKLVDIKTIYSHPKALAQSKKYIYDKKFKTEETSSTSEAKDILIKLNDKTIAAIGGKDLLKNSDLEILDENIGDNMNNITRFVVVASKEYSPTIVKKNKISFMFTLPHIPGSLAAILTEFAKAQLNLTKVESRPVPGTSWEYQFWVDIEDEKGDLNEKQLGDILLKNTATYKIIGIYEKGEIFES